MLSRIKRLDPITANQIAAGEVVERPVSVVKELLENSIDAGSTRVDIEIREGGTSFIRISDNGCGITPEDAVLAFERHATSKINSLDDLYSIQTLGFRGEALPSIASVARVEMLTRTRDNLAGTLVAYEGGKLLKVEETGAPPGTTLIVRDLFFNTPARRKHLRSVGTEGGLIGDIITRLALAYPALAFTFTQNSRLVFQSGGSGDLLTAISSTQGVQNAKEYLPLQAKEELFSLEGFLGKPVLSRASRSQQILFINGRYVKSKLVSMAIEEAYHTLLTIGRFPAFIINLKLNPHLVDVNVHPTKMEVRFSEERQLQSFIVQAVKQVLNESNRTAILVDSYSKVTKQEQSQPLQQHVIQLEQQPIIQQAPPQEQTALKMVQEQRDYAAPSKTLNRPSEITQQETPICNPNIHFVKADTVRETLLVNNYAPKGHTQGQAENIFVGLQVLGQVDSTYIIASGLHGLYVFDQHAVDERIQYEKLLNHAQDATLTQALLLPITVELSSLEAELVVAQILLFREIGYILEHFGGNTFLIRSAPSGLAAGEESQLFFDLLDQLKSNNQYQVDKLKIREEFRILHACKSAIKANQALTKPAMEELIKQLGDTNQPFNCPHGRPTLVKYSSEDMAKIFKRT